MLPLIANRRAGIADLCRRYHVRRLDVFGSGAPSLKAFFALRQELELALGGPSMPRDPRTFLWPAILWDVRDSADAIAHLVQPPGVIKAPLRKRMLQLSAAARAVEKLVEKHVEKIARMVVLTYNYLHIRPLAVRCAPRNPEPAGPLGLFCYEGRTP
jgi:hypothetical protein